MHYVTNRAGVFVGQVMWKYHESERKHVFGCSPRKEIFKVQYNYNEELLYEKEVS